MVKALPDPASQFWNQHHRSVAKNIGTVAVVSGFRRKGNAAALI